MAKHRKNRGATYAPQAMRGHRVTATRPGILPGLVRLPTKTLELDLRDVEDRRTYPEAVRENLYRSLSGAAAQISRRPTRSAEHAVSRLPPPLYHRFETPRRVPVCIRRETRRRVLFALQRTGRGGRSNRKARWTARSFVRCK